MDFVLLHGTTQSPAGWDRLVAALRRRGHGSIVIDLPVDQPDLSATDYARFVADRVDVERPVVVGHSGAGLLIPAVASTLDWNASCG